MLTLNPRPLEIHRRDLYYVQYRVRSRQTTRVYYREILVDQWDWFFSYRLQWRRFEKVRGFHLLRERDDWPTTYVDMVNPFPEPVVDPLDIILADFKCESQLTRRYVPQPRDFDLGDS